MLGGSLRVIHHPGSETRFIASLGGKTRCAPLRLRIGSLSKTRWVPTETTKKTTDRKEVRAWSLMSLGRKNDIMILKLK